MSDLMERVLGFMPQSGIFWMALGLTIFMLLVQRLSDWLTKKLQLPWMEEKNQQQRTALEKEETK